MLLIMVLATLSLPLQNNLKEAEEFFNKNDHDAVVLILKDFHPKNEQELQKYLYMKGVSNYFVNNHKVSKANLLDLLNLNDVSLRYQTIAWLILQEMKSNDDLSKIAKQMKRVEHRLSNHKGDLVTQNLQKKIIEDLDKLIKEEEDKLSSKNDTQQSGSSKNESPQKDSQIENTSGPGNVTDKQLKGIAQQWGKLPEKDRAKAMQDLAKELPSRYRELTENYFRRISVYEK